MKSKIFLFLLTGFLLMATTVSAQLDSAAVAKRQKELDKSEKEIKSAQAKVDKKERKMAKAQRRADRKARKAEKKLDKLRRAERKHDKIIRDTTTSYLQPLKNSSIVALRTEKAEAFTVSAFTPDPADRVYDRVRV